MILALCTESEIFHNNALKDQKVANYYFASETPYIYQKFIENGWEVVSGDIALKNVQHGSWNPKKIYIFQSSISKNIAEKLISLGAHPLISLLNESAAVAFREYDCAHQYINKYPYYICSDGLDEILKKRKPIKSKHISHLWPSYENKNLKKFDFKKNIEKWDDRYFSNIIAGNKWHIEKIQYFKHMTLLNNFKHIILNTIYKNYFSSTFKAVKNSELREKRMELISKLAPDDKIHIYGNGWNNCSHLPKKWHYLFQEPLSTIFKGPTNNKRFTMRNYKFSICYENVRVKGWITEKIFQIFLTGSIPVYLGAPDVENYIPKETFINVDNFENDQDMIKYMSSMSSEQTKKILELGYEWISSKAGYKYSNEYYASNIYDLVNIYLRD